MMQGCRLTWAVPCMAVVLAVNTGCVRDGTFTPQGSIKDTYSAAPAPRHAAVKSTAPKMMSKTVVPDKVPDGTKMAAAPPPSAVVEPAIAKAAPPAPPAATAAAPAPPQSMTTGAAVQVPTPPQATPPVQMVRRPPVSGMQFLEEGRVLFRNGEVLAARERFVAALSAPLPDVLHELARTYDPAHLARLPKADAEADVDRARALYEQATALGSKAAEADLMRLRSQREVTPR